MSEKHLEIKMPADKIMAGLHEALAWVKGDTAINVTWGDAGSRTTARLSFDEYLIELSKMPPDACPSAEVA